MHLKVLKRGTRYRGEIYNVGDKFEVDPKGHNVAQEVRYLTALGRVEETADVKPVGRVASTHAPPAPAAPPPEAAAEPKQASEAVREPPPSRGSGRTSRRDLRAQD